MRIKKKTMSSMAISSAECSTWYAVSLTINVAVVAVNLLSIILFVKNSNLRTRAMYLVINLTVVDMFVGGSGTFSVAFYLLLYGCEAGNIFLTLPEWSPIKAVLSVTKKLLPPHLYNRHCSNFFRSDACDVSSIQASQHQKMGLRGNNCGRLDFNCDDSNSLSVNKSLWELATTVAIGISFVLMAVILLPLPYCYLCFLHLHCFKISVWNPSSVPWCGQ